eukprot:6009345-Prorocentrum_lima.AAC.1
MDRGCSGVGKVGTAEEVDLGTWGVKGRAHHAWHVHAPSGASWGKCVACHHQRVIAKPLERKMSSLTLERV